jgi:hypothetical protein
MESTTPSLSSTAFTISALYLTSTQDISFSQSRMILDICSVGTRPGSSVMPETTSEPEFPSATEQRLRRLVQDEILNLQLALEEEIERKYRTLVHHQDAPVKPATNQKALPRIVVFGLLNAQGNLVRERCKKCAKVVVHSKDDATRGTLPKADFAVLMTKFIGHDLQDAIKEKYGKSLRLCHGGQDNLINLIKTLTSQA